VTQFLLDLVSRFGYGIVFAGVGVESMGVPVPGETALVIGAVLAAQGRLAPWGVALAAWAGAVTGDNIGYFVGRRFGDRLVRLPVLRLVYDQRRIAVADRFFARWGVLAVFFGRFVALLRILAGPLAGIHRMPWTHFVVANAAGGAVWVAAITTIGLLIGNNLDRAVSVVSQAGYIGLGAAALLVVGFVAWWHATRARRERALGELILAQSAKVDAVADEHPPDTDPADRGGT
jgi:membrane protein DedA with SNARE-associated domain